MKKAITLLLALVMVVSLFAACAAKPEPEAQSTEAAKPEENVTEPTKAEESVTLKVAMWDYQNIAYWADVYDAFMEANPNIKIEILDIPAADYNTKLNVMLNGGSEVDVFLVKEAGILCDLEAKGQCLPLDEYVKADNLDLSVYNGIAETFNLNGKQCALPTTTSFYVLFYNKDLFDAAGKDYPSNDMTWEEYEQLAMDMTSGEGANKVYGSLLHTWPAMVQNWAVQDGKHTMMSYETGYDFFKPYYEMALRLQDAGALQSYGELKSANIHYSGAFCDGNVATMPMGTWFASSLAHRIANGEGNIKNWGIATLPHPASVEAGYTVGASTPICINPTSKVKDAAWELLKFVSSEEGQNIIASAGDIPAMLNDEARAMIAAADGMPEGLAEALAVKNIVPDRPIVADVTEVNDMLGQEHSLIMLGECTVDEGLKNMADRAAEILK